LKQVWFPEAFARQQSAIQQFQSLDSSGNSHCGYSARIHFSFHFDAAAGILSPISAACAGSCTAAALFTSLASDVTNRRFELRREQLAAKIVEVDVVFTFGVFRAIYISGTTFRRLDVAAARERESTQIHHPATIHGRVYWRLRRRFWNSFGARTDIPRLALRQARLLRRRRRVENRRINQIQLLVDKCQRIIAGDSS